VCSNLALPGACGLNSSSSDGITRGPYTSRVGRRRYARTVGPDGGPWNQFDWLILAAGLFVSPFPDVFVFLAGLGLRLLAVLDPALDPPLLRGLTIVAIP
jgi:hypothetical protein